MELRQVMSKMLGLSSVEFTSTADFELVTRLETLILNNEFNVTSKLPVDQAISDLASAYRDRAAESPTPGDDDTDGPPDSSRSREGHSAGSRSRSLSPVRTRDPNVY